MFPLGEEMILLGQRVELAGVNLKIGFKPVSEMAGFVAGSDA